MVDVTGFKGKQNVKHQNRFKDVHAASLQQNLYLKNWKKTKINNGNSRKYKNCPNPKYTKSKNKTRENLKADSK